MQLPPKTGSDTSSLISYLEIWRHEPESQNVGNEETHSGKLILENAVVFENDGARQVNATGEVSRGEGLVGSAWQQESAVIFQDQNCATLESTRSQAGVPLVALVAVPIYEEYTLVSVVVLGLRAGAGGVEIWSRDDRDELAVSGAYYSGLKTLEFISQHVKFPKGAGLPGHCWKFSRAQLIYNPDKNPDFIRSFDRDEADLSLCVGIPISREYGFPASVLLLLSDSETPIAQETYIWDCQSSQSTKENPFPEVEFDSSCTAETPELKPWVDVLGKRMAEERRVIFESDPTQLPQGVKGILSIPLFERKALDHVITFVF